MTKPGHLLKTKKNKNFLLMIIFKLKLFKNF